MYPEVASAIILARVERERKALRDAALEFFSESPQYDYLKPVVRVLTLNTLRNYMLLDYIIDLVDAGKSFKGFKKWLLRVVTYEIVFGGKAKISRIGRILDKLGVRRGFIQDLKNIDVDEIKRNLVKVNRLDIAYSMPKWIISMLRRARIPRLEEFLEALLKDPIVWLRASIHRIPLKRIVKLLSNEGFKVKSDESLPDCIRVIEGDRGSLAKTRLYELGYYVIQDKASIIVGHVADPRDKIIYDMTSGAGLKTTHFIQLGAKLVIAQDILFRKHEDAVELARRLNLPPKILFVTGDSTLKPPIHDTKVVDVFVIDPPCSGIGRMALQPELKLHLTQDDVKKFVRLQYRLLNTAINSAHRGAKILYSTCTLTLEENEDLVMSFEREGYVEIVSQKPFLGSKSYYKPLIQRLYPHIHGTQGFTITLMEVI